MEPISSRYPREVNSAALRQLFHRRAVNFALLILFMCVFLGGIAMLGRICPAAQDAWLMEWLG